MLRELGQFSDDIEHDAVLQSTFLLLVAICQQLTFVLNLHKVLLEP